MAQRRISDFFSRAEGGGSRDENRNREERGVGSDERRHQQEGTRGGGSGRGGRGGRGEGGGGGGRGGSGGGGGRGGRRGGGRHPARISYDWSEELTNPHIPIPLPTRDVRAALCVEVMRQTPHILAQHPEASARSVYYPAAIPRLEPSFTTPFPPATIKVIDGDTYTVGQTVLLAGAGGGTNPRKGKVAVINLASELRPGGGWKNGSLAQEESLCYRSTLFATLDNKNHYPLTPIGIVYSPGVVVFRKEMKDHFAQYTDAHERFILSVVSVAGLRRPPVNARTGEFSSPSLQILLDEKIRQTLRVLVLNEQEYIVLGALGCGAFDNPPELVAKTFLRILGEPEWKGRFREIVFAVMAGNGRQVLATRRSTEDSSMEVDDPAPEPSPGRVNYLKFHALLDGVVIG